MDIDKNRKGARSFKDLKPEIIEALNGGELESVNLTEWLAVDSEILVSRVLKDEYQSRSLQALRNEGKPSAMSSIKIIGQCLNELMMQNKGDDLLCKLKNHVSDTVRCWAAYCVGFDDRLTVVEKLEEIKFYASDGHFGVREIAWMAVRDELNSNLDQVLPILEEWSTSEDVNIRRFATESIRPKGVWCKQIDELKNNPEKALLILNNLKADPSRYVQDSVANWLNDASKTRPDFVSQLCAEWMSISACAETKYIVKRALRSIR